MFENILFQDKIVETLKHDIEQRQLPQTILFVGPSWAGKFSTALELARVVSCKQGAEWNCTCSSCISQKHLINPFILIAGLRQFSQEIRACAQTLLAEDKMASRFLFIRSVRKLLKRFDQVLWDGEAKFAKAAKVAEKVIELLSGFEPEGKNPIHPKDVDALIGLCDELTEFLPYEGYNANLIRRITYWTHTASAESPKFVILESAEHMNEAARNALLKTLEEPPPNVWFILISKSRQGIMPTILSRSRVYSFIDRASRDQDVLGRIFKRAPNEFANLHDFFSRAHREVFDAVERLSQTTWAAFVKKAGLGSVLGHRQASLSEALAMSASSKDQLEALVKRLLSFGSRDLVKLSEGEDNLRDLDALQGLMRLIGDIARDSLVYNRSISGFIETVYGRIGGLQCVALSKEP